MIKRITITAYLILLPITVLGDDVDPGKGVEAFFTRYCSRCHDAKKHEGEFQLDTLSRDLTDMLVARSCRVDFDADRRRPRGADGSTRPRVALPAQPR